MPSAPLVIHRQPGWAPGWEALPRRNRAAITGVVVHRIEVSQADASFGDSPAEIARFFREHPEGVEATGGGMPYPVVIENQGRVSQTLPFTRVSPHAALHNPHTLGIAVVGDFRQRPPSREQWRSLVVVSSALLCELGQGPDALSGHDELVGGTRQPGKQCPGGFLDMADLRREVAPRVTAGTRPLGFAWDA